MALAKPSWSKAISQTPTGAWRIDTRELARCLRLDVAMLETDRLTLAKAFEDGALIRGTLKPKPNFDEEKRLVALAYEEAYRIAADPKQPPKTKEITRSKRALEITAQILEREHGLGLSLPTIRNRLRDSRKAASRK